MSSTEIVPARIAVARTRRPMRVLKLRVRRRKSGLHEYAAYVHSNWRNMTPHEAGEAGQQLGWLLDARRARQAATR